MTFTLFSPAKINLFLHVTGKRPDGYHLLDSLIAFADIGDTLAFAPAAQFHFDIDGPFASSFGETERLASAESQNIIVRTAYALSREFDRPLDISVRLSKNLPLAAGIGGGSGNAAALIRGLLRHWELELPAQALQDFMLEIGADVPVCYRSETAWIRDVGVPVETTLSLPEIPVVLVNPLKPSPTAEVFKRFNGPIREDLPLPGPLDECEALITFLQTTQNDLRAPAMEGVPDISNILNMLDAQNGCLLGRISGSGATCFGLFSDVPASEHAARQILARHPEWWVKTGVLGRAGQF